VSDTPNMVARGRVVIALEMCQLCQGQMTGGIRLGSSKSEHGRGGGNRFAQRLTAGRAARVKSLTVFLAKVRCRSIVMMIA
jgi:hypothetical protein